MSVMPPAAYGTMMRTGLLGYVCATTVVLNAMRESNAAQGKIPNRPIISDRRDGRRG
jgi:hypothetical protein